MIPLIRHNSQLRQLNYQNILMVERYSKDVIFRADLHRISMQNFRLTCNKMYFLVFVAINVLQIFKMPVSLPSYIWSHTVDLRTRRNFEITNKHKVRIHMIMLENMFIDKKRNQLIEKTLAKKNLNQFVWMKSFIL